MLVDYFSFKKLLRDDGQFSNCLPGVGYMLYWNSLQFFQFIQLPTLLLHKSSYTTLNLDINIRNLPQTTITPSTTHNVQSGMYFIKTRDINAHIVIRYPCCKSSGPFQCIHIMPRTPKFHISNTTEIRSIGTL